MAPPKILVVDDNQELLRLLSRLVEEAGYEVLPASKGKLALELARAEKPAVAVLDVLLPDMIGQQLAEAIYGELRIPIVFMTGVFKGGKHAAEARQKLGVNYYFEKPFEARKLVEALQTLVKPEPQSVAESIEDAFDVELDIDVVEEKPPEPMELTGVVRVSGGDRISAVLRGDPLKTATGPAEPGRVRAAPAGRLLTPGPVPLQDPKSRRGVLRDNLPALITAFHLSLQSGELGVQRGKVKKAVCFEKGAPVFAHSNLVSDRFAQFLVRVGKISNDHLVKATTAAEQRRCRTGDVLAEMGLLQETERLYYVGQHVKSIIYSLFGWEDGVYNVAFENRARAEPIKLDVHPANLIMRGVKKLYRPERLKRLLQGKDRLLPSLQPAYNLSDLEMEKWESLMLPKVDGTRTVAELVALSGKPEVQVMGLLCALMALSILERRQ